jgi:cytoskeletal protein RodZ
LDAFGDRLRRTRETRGLPLEKVADATRIARHHLAALERSDVGALPAGPFAKGYIRAYAEYLGVDPQPILEAYRSEEKRRGLDAAHARDRTIEELSHIVAQRAAAAGRTGRPAVDPRVLGVALVATGAVALAAWLLTVGPAPPSAGDAATSPPVEGPAPRGDAVGPERRLPSAAGSRPDAGDAAPAGGPTASAAPSEPPQPRAAPARTEPTAAPRAGRTAEPREPSNLQVSESGVGTGVRNHQLIGRADLFSPGTPLVFWTRVLGGRPGDSIRHVWFHEGRAVMRADLEIGGPHWRTHSRLDLPERAIGSWAVEARGPDGRLLAHQEFQCVREAQ